VITNYYIECNENEFLVFFLAGHTFLVFLLLDNIESVQNVIHNRVLYTVLLLLLPCGNIVFAIYFTVTVYKVPNKASIFYKESPQNKT